MTGQIYLKCLDQQTINCTVTFGNVRIYFLKTSNIPCRPRMGKHDFLHKIQTIMGFLNPKDDTAKWGKKVCLVYVTVPSQMRNSDTFCHFDILISLQTELVHWFCYYNNLKLQPPQYLILRDRQKKVFIIWNLGACLKYFLMTFIFF